MKKVDIYEWIADYVSDNYVNNGEELLIGIDGRNICKVVVNISGEEGENIDFKVHPLR